MDCCSVNGLDQMFDQANARKELKAYWKKGLDKRARLLVDFLKAQDLAGSSLLEIGFGIGALHLELLKAGAGKAVGVEASPAYLQAARALAEQLGLQDAVVYQRMDFAQRGQEVAEADIVLLDRVICCYPDMVGLVTSSAQHARRFYALTFPRGAWWMRLAGFLFNAFMA
ncbi:MAG: class I SAM-dependent methyltransferase, partial [Dehalococcoidia bacterium]